MVDTPQFAPDEPVKPIESSGPIFHENEPVVPIGGTEAPDHGLSERQKLSPVGKALSPFTSYPEIYRRMREEALEQASSGVKQLANPGTGIDPYTGEKGVDVGDIGAGLFKAATGTAGFVASPLSAAYRAIIGQPGEDVTGIPREWTETAAQLATPGIGLTSLKSALKVPPPILKPVAPSGPFGVALTEGERTGDLAARQAEQAALRGQAGKPAQEHAEEFLNVQRPEQLEQAKSDVVRSLDPGRQELATNPAEAADLVQRTLQSEAARSKAGVKTLYDRAKALPGEIDSNVFTGMPQDIKSTLSSRPESVIIDDNTPVASRMINYLDNQIGQLRIKNLADPHAPPNSSSIIGVNLEGVDQWRKNLSRMRGETSFANPSDQRAASAVVNEFDRRIQDAVNSGAFRGDPRAVDAFNQARAAASERFKTWGDDPIGKKLQAIIGNVRKDPASLNDVANFIYSASGTSPNSLNIGVANRIKNVLGESSPEWAAVRQGLFHRLVSTAENVADRGAGTIANRIGEFLNGKGADLAKVMFTPPQRDILNQYAALHRQLSVPQVAANWPNTAAGVIPAIRAVTDKVLGAVGAFIGHHVMPVAGAFVGWQAGEKASSVLNAAENARNLRQIAQQMPLLSQRMKVWQQAVKQQQRANTLENQSRKAIAATNVASALGKLGVDHGAALRLLRVEGPGTSNAEEQPPQRARGGKVQPVLVSKATLLAQQKQLLEGNRDAQLFPNGKDELKLPKGLYRAKMDNGDVFHYHPKRMNVKRLKAASKSGRENEVLGLGPHNKIEVMSRAQAGEHPIAVVERDPKGTEVRAAAGTHVLAANQVAALSNHKSPGHTVHIERPDHTLARRASGGQIRGFADGGIPTGDDDLNASAPVSDVSPKHFHMNMGAEGNSQQLPADDGVPTSSYDKAVQNAWSTVKSHGSGILNQFGTAGLPEGEEKEKLNKKRDALLGANGEERYQTWPERMIRSGGSLAHDLMTGEQPLLQPGIRREDVTDIPAPTEPTEDSTWLGKKLNIAPVGWQPNDQTYERVQDMAGMAGMGGVGGTGPEAGAALGSSPFLRPALKYEGKIYKAPVGGQHLDAIPPEVYPEFQRQAMNGEDISNFNFGFMNHKGQFLDRMQALDYAVREGMMDPRDASAGVLTSTASLKPTTYLKPAVKMADGKVYEGEAGTDHLAVINSLPEAAKKGDYDLGYTNDQGKYLNRKQGLDYALKHNLINKEKLDRMARPVQREYGLPSEALAGYKSQALLSDTSKPGAALSALEHQGADTYGRPFSEPAKAPEMKMAEQAPSTNLPAKFEPTTIESDVQNFLKLAQGYESKLGSDWISKLSPQELQELKSQPAFAKSIANIDAAKNAGIFNKVLNTPIDRRALFSGASVLATTISNASKLATMLERVAPPVPVGPTAAETALTKIGSFSDAYNARANKLMNDYKYVKRKIEDKIIEEKREIFRKYELRNSRKDKLRNGPSYRGLPGAEREIDAKYKPELDRMHQEMRQQYDALEAEAKKELTAHREALNLPELSEEQQFVRDYVVKNTKTEDSFKDSFIHRDLYNLEGPRWEAEEGKWFEERRKKGELVPADIPTLLSKMSPEERAQIAEHIKPALMQDNFLSLGDMRKIAKVFPSLKGLVLFSDTTKPGAALAALEHAEPLRTPEMKIAEAPPNSIPQIFKPLAEAKPEITKNIQDFVNLSRDMEKKYGTSDWVSKLTPEDVAAIKADPKYIDATNKMNGAALEGAFTNFLNQPVARRNFLTNTAAAARLVASSGKLGKLLESVAPKEEPFVPPEIPSRYPYWSELTKEMKKEVYRRMDEEDVANGGPPETHGSRGYFNKDEEASEYYDASPEDFDFEPIHDFAEFRDTWPNDVQQKLDNEIKSNNDSWNAELAARKKYNMDTEVPDISGWEKYRQNEKLDEINNKASIYDIVSAVEEPFNRTLDELEKKYDGSQAWWDKYNATINKRDQALSTAVRLLSDSSTTGAPLAALEHAQPFYSAVEKTIQSAPQSKMHGEQWANWLKNQNGVKPDELQYTGIDKWLREQKGPITKEQVQDYIAQNKVQVNDVVKSSDHRIDLHATEEEAYRKLHEAEEDSRNEPNSSALMEEVNRLRAEYNSAYKALNYLPKYHDYQLQGGENYREHLLTLPKKEIVPTQEMLDTVSQQLYGWDFKYDDIPANQQAQVRSDIRNYPRIALGAGHPALKQNYRSSHWDEPNVIAHVRTNERDVQGGYPDNAPKSSHHIEEIQSDFAQQGRKHGFIGQPFPGSEKWKAEPTQFGQWHVKTPDGRRIDAVDAPDAKTAIDKVAREYTPPTSTRVPDMPFKQTEQWASLAMKRMIQQAIDEGKSRISWMPGEAQAARYDLSKQLNSINVVKEGNIKAWWPEDINGRTHGNIVTDLDGKIIKAAAQWGDIVGKHIDDVIGKDVAEKGLKSDQKETKLTGVDLKVGGEGMKGFYDKILPNIVQKLGKQYGVKVKEGTIPSDGKQVHEETPEWARRHLKIPNSDKQKVLYFDIPPKMREDVIKKGFPLFSDTAHGGLLNQNAKKDKQDIERPVEKAKAEPEVNVPKYAVKRAAGGRIVARNIASPTPAQAKAGNYSKDHIHIFGLPITIENAKGSMRHGVGPDGHSWSSKLPEAYGYIKQTTGADKDHLDVYVGPHIRSGKVFVVNQIDLNTNQFDETKSMIGFRNLQHAIDTYAKAFSDGKGLQRIGSIVPTDMKTFKEWVRSSNHHKPFPAMRKAA